MNEVEYRKKYNIREATPEEIERMTEEQRWHYFAAAHKPLNMHFEFFKFEGKFVRPLYLMHDGTFDYPHLHGSIGVMGAKAALRPFCIAPKEGGS